MVRNFFYKTVWVVSYIFGWPLIRLFYKMKITVDPNAYKLKAPLIFVSNHKSPFDPWLVSIALPFSIFLRILPVNIMGSRKFISSGLNMMGKMGIINLVYGIYGVITLPELTQREDKLRPFRMALERGESVLMFPEGRMREEESIGTFKEGAALLHIATHAPILISSIKFEGKKWRRKCIVNFGQTLSHVEDRSAAEVTKTTREGIERLYSQ